MREISKVLKEKLKTAVIDATSFSRRLKRCSACRGMCCYDGVYLTEKGEDKRLESVVQENRDFFSRHAPFALDKPVVIGKWRNTSGLKTANLHTTSHYA